MTVTEEKPSPDTMTLTEHLAELRVRIIRSALAVLIGMVLVIAFYDQVYEFLVRPYDDLCSTRPEGFCSGELNAFSPTEGFSARLRVGMYGGIFLALPVILWQIWRFVVPALEAKEKKYAIPFVLTSVVLFSAGAVLAYLTIGRALEFLISWAGSEVETTFGIEKYFALVGFMVFAFGIGFLLPVLLVFLQLVQVVTPGTLLRGWRYAIVGIFVLAAVITPSGDPITLMTLAIPMTALYFVAVLIGYLAPGAGTDPLRDPTAGERARGGSRSFGTAERPAVRSRPLPAGRVRRHRCRPQRRGRGTDGKREDARGRVCDRP